MNKQSVNTQMTAALRDLDPAGPTVLTARRPPMPPSRAAPCSRSPTGESRT